MAACTIRLIQKKDNLAVEAIIRSCLREFGADHEGTAWEDPDLARFSEVYSSPGRAYWVAEAPDGTILGGAGIGELEGVKGVCELQKMYCIPQARGRGISHLLIHQALSYAKEYYEKCYLETFECMKAAQKFYRKYGFEPLDAPLGSTGH